MKNSYRTWIEVDSQAFNNNVSHLADIIGPRTALGVVVKADAYGHGLELIGKLCQEHPAVSWLFTAGLGEAVRLREDGVTKPILVLAYLDEAYEYLADYQITCNLADMHVAHALAEVAQRTKKDIVVHIKVDTGMSRLGFQHHDIARIIEDLASFKGLRIEGMSTHLSDTNNSDYAFTRQQLMLFNEAVMYAESVLKKKLYTHVLASGSLHLTYEYNYACVRIGTNAYGYWKSPLQQQRLQALSSDISLQPVLTWKTRIIDIKHINAGNAVGYHRAFIAAQPMKIAILPVGYYDGYPRALSHKGKVLVRKTYAPIIGIISMNLMVIDVTAIDSVRIGDEVTLCGDFPGLTAHDLAVVIDSLYLEFLARICPRIPRVLV